MEFILVHVTWSFKYISLLIESHLIAQVHLKYVD